MEQTTFTTYFSPRGFEPELEQELALKKIPIHARYGRIFVCSKIQARKKPEILWADDVWEESRYLNFTSIGEAVKHLKTHKVRYTHYTTKNHRRGEFILEGLPSIKSKRIDFLSPLPDKPRGIFTLLSENEMLYSPHCLSKIPLGEHEFVEDKSNPPSRAYLKLWELFTIHGIVPKPQETCLDLGACPGGWTWVLANLGCKVISVDKAELDPRLMSDSKIQYLSESAFGLDPKSIGPVDWLFSDIICYPEKLLGLVEKWRAAGTVKNFACTIKFQGETDYKTLDAFKQIPGSKIIHLYHNKHEVTWVCTL